MSKGPEDLNQESLILKAREMTAEEESGDELPPMKGIFFGGSDVAVESQSLAEPPLDETIKFEDLPIIWQEHINQRKAGGFLRADKNIFTKQELLRASSAETSFTPSAIVDKVFARINKEKIDFVDLPPAWQERLKNENTFGNFTVEYLKKLGALDKDIVKIKADAEAKKVAGLKKDIQTTAKSFAELEKAGQAFLKSATKESMSEKPATEVLVKKSWGSKFRGWLGF